MPLGISTASADPVASLKTKIKTNGLIANSVSPDRQFCLCVDCTRCSGLAARYGLKSTKGVGFGRCPFLMYADRPRKEVAAWLCKGDRHVDSLDHRDRHRRWCFGQVYHARRQA